MVTTRTLEESGFISSFFFSSPKCRVKVTGKKKNVVISGILEAYLKANPQKRPVLQPIDNQSKCKVLKTSTSTHHVRRKWTFWHTLDCLSLQINCNRMVVDDTQDDEEEDDDDVSTTSHYTSF